MILKVTEPGLTLGIGCEWTAAVPVYASSIKNRFLACRPRRNAVIALTRSGVKEVYEWSPASIIPLTFSAVSAIMIYSIGGTGKGVAEAPISCLCGQSRWKFYAKRDLCLPEASELRQQEGKALIPTLAFMWLAGSTTPGRTNNVCWPNSMA